MERYGIICFETGEVQSRTTKDQFSARTLLQFLKEAKKIDEFIYRQIVTREELSYYINQIGTKSFKNKYNIVYFSFHGEPEKICLNLKSGETVSFDDIADMASHNNSLSDRHIHFSSCETMKTDESIIKRFKRDIQAKTVSGYTKCVDSTDAYINELAYFNQILSYSSISTIKKHMADYQNQIAKLGFTIL